MATSTETSNFKIQQEPLGFDRVVTTKLDLKGNNTGKASVTFNDPATGNAIDGDIVSAWAEILDDHRNFQYLYVNYLGQPNNMEPPDGSNIPGSKQSLTLSFRLLDQQKAAFIRLHAFIK